MEGSPDRSVYSMLFPTTPVSRTPGRRLERTARDESSIHEYTVSLAGLEAGISNVSVNSSVIPRASPASQDAHKEFCDALYTMGRNDTFMVNPIPLVERYAKLSKDVRTRLTSASEAKELTEFFHKEKCTWTLVWALLTAAQGGDSNMDMDCQFKVPASDAEEVDDLFDTSCDFRTAQTLVDWLETRYAEEKCTSNTASLHAFKESGGMYDATRHLISTERASRDIITELDPDAPIRQNKTLHEQDVEDDHRLYRCVFELIRAGKHREAQKLAMSQGHFMLAAGMQGWKAFKGNIRDENGALLPDEGNPYRDVWKVVVWKKLNDDRVSSAEKAIYATLSGNLEMLLPMCPRWEDQLWAHLKTLVDVAIELHLRNVRGADLGPLPEEYPKENETLDQILKGLESRPELEGAEFFRQLHKFLMLQDPCGLVSYMLEVARETADVVNRRGQISHQLRLMANLALFFKYSCIEDDAALNDIHFIVTIYVHRLIDEGLYELAPKYVLHLPDNLRESCYLHLMRTLRPKNFSDAQRLAIIEAAQKESIAIYKYLTRFVVETIHSDETEITDWAQQRDEVTEEDLRKIDALKWLFAQRGHSLLGLKYVNAALRSTILHQRPQAARSVIALVPPESVHEMAAMAVEADISEAASTSAQGENLQTSSRSGVGAIDSLDLERNGDTDGSPADYRKFLKEFLCFQEYLEALQSFNEWFQHYHRERPNAPAIAADGSTARDALSVEFARRTLATKMDAWRATLGSLCDRATRHLYGLLSNSEEAFMRDPVEEIDPDIEAAEMLGEETRRTEELKALRRICLPQITSLLHIVLHGTGRYAEAIEIANLIAGCQLSLYKEFTRDDIATLLVKIQESSVELLKVPGNVDPYGIIDL